MGDAVCGWHDEDETGLPIGAKCGQPAEHHSCVWGGPACAKHKCRCEPKAPKFRMTRTDEVMSGSEDAITARERGL
jgi:hypothetical protein